MAEEEKRRIVRDQPPLEYAQDVPQLFIDGFQGISLVGGVVRLNLWEHVYRPDSDVERVRRVMLRLIMPVETFLGMHRAMGDIANELARESNIPQGQTPEPERKE